MAIMLVEDEQDLADIVTYTLRRSGYEVLAAYDGYAALRLIKRRSPSLILLDIVLPRIDGWQVLQQLRSWSNVPVIMLTGVSSDNDVVRGLRMGADDYITKPFSPAQLVARVESVLRRSSTEPNGSRTRTIELDGLTLDVGLHRVTVEGRTVNLTRIEFRLLHELALHAGELVTHEELARRVWGYHESPHGSITKSHIRNLRRKIEPDPAHPRYLHTVPGLGYRLQGGADVSRFDENGDANGPETRN
jgi:DNA-binding response OmpR family regulator